MNRNTIIHPGAFRVKIQPSPPQDDEESEQMPGRMPKPVGPKTNRGVVVEVGPGIIEDEEDTQRWSFLHEGAVVYYKGGYLIDGYIFIECSMDSIIAYEN